MQAQPVRLTVEIHAPQLVQLSSHLLRALTSPPEPKLNIVVDQVPATSPASASDPEEEDGVPASDRTADPPPEASGALRPVLPKKMQERYYLGKVCGRQHRYKGSASTLRFLRNNGCVACERERQRERSSREAPPPPVGAPSNGHRPTLPAHLAAYAFLSPITCSNPLHRYRGLDTWTLRYTRDETCVQCNATAIAIAGD